MSRPAYDLIRQETTRDIKNAYILLGIDLSDLSPTRPWTPDGDVALIEFIDQGLQIPQIAQDFNRTIEDVEQRVCVMVKAGRLDLRRWGSKKD